MLTEAYFNTENLFQYLITKNQMQIGSAGVEINVHKHTVGQSD